MSHERPSQHIGGLPLPLSELPWSSDFVMQAIEILPVTLRDGLLLSLRPDCADSFIVGWSAGARPEEITVQAMRQLGLQPIMVHSTSWRHADPEVVLTYLAVVAMSGGPPPSWEAAPIMRAELARGDATAPPAGIDVLQVVEHALRHLAWLVHDDPAIASTLPGWIEILADYVPEPFRAFGAPASQP